MSFRHAIWKKRSSAARVGHAGPETGGHRLLACGFSLLASVLLTHGRRIVAVAVVLVLYVLARAPELSADQRASLAKRFRFERAALPDFLGGGSPGHAPRSVRPVAPSLERISAWISSVGAAVALNDLDGDGLPNDVCYVDTRTDRVIVAPAPGTGKRYQPFVLNPAPLPFDAATMAPMGCLPGDMNEDGRMDLLVYYWGRTPIAFLRRAGSLDAAAFTPAEIAPQAGERWYTNAAAFADLDGDGHADLIIGNYFPDGARILDTSAGGVEAMQHSMSRAANGGRTRFLLWKPAGAGVDYRDADPGLDGAVLHGWTLGVAAADLDGDLLPEVYLANDFGPDRLLHNRSTPGHLRLALLEGEKSALTPNSKVLGRDSFKGMGVEFADLNGDGWPDIYVSNIAAPYALEESHFVFLSTGDTRAMRRGIAPYVDRSEQLGLSRSGWAWEARLADFDNDGVLEAMQATGFVRGDVNRWPELHELAMGNDELIADPRAWPRFRPGDDLSGWQRNPFFVRGPGGRYFDIAPELGIDGPRVSRGIAIADVDGDGQLDFAIANQWDRSFFFHNTSPDAGAFLELRLLLPPGRPAIGAAARVRCPGGRILTGQVDGGNGHSGKRSSEIHFGLGNISGRAALEVEVAWRDATGRHERRFRLAPGRHTLLLGQSGAEGDRL